MNYNQLISKISQSEYTIHPVKREWRAIIAILLILKFSTMAISMFSDFFFFGDFLIPIINNTIVVYIATILFLVLIEFIVAILLTKLAKFGIRKQYNKTVIIGLFCVFIFGINFYTSTNGLANRQAKKADKTENISQLKQLKIDNISNEYDNRIAELKTQSKLIENNPLQWINGQMKALTGAQLKQITNISDKIDKLNEIKNSQIMAIESNFKKHYSKNDLLVSEIAQRYYIFISIILLVKLVSNIGLMFFFSMIYKEENNTSLLQNEINSYYSEMQQNLIEQKISEYKALNNQINNIFLNQSGVKQLPPKVIETAVKKIGFKPVNEPKKDNESPVKNDNNGLKQPVNGLNNGLKDVNQLNVCPFCGINFKPKNSQQIYCCPAHKVSNWHLNKIK